MDPKRIYIKSAQTEIAEFRGRHGLLISMPMASLHHPAIGLALLQGCLARAGLQCEIRHLYLEFAEFIGLEKYAALNEDRYFLALVGEWAFSASVHGEDSEHDLQYVAKVLCGEYRNFIDAATLIRIISAKKQVANFLQHCVELIDWEKYDFIGFSSSFQQSMASLALAKLVKKSFPRTLIVFGGANCEGEMGVELLEQYSFVDAVIGGEAESSLVNFLRAHFSGNDATTVRGVISRRNFDRPDLIQTSQPNDALDELPYLDYGDFIRDRASAPTVSATYAFVPLFESARGCWWGERNHCTFCGLNALGMNYRSKSQSRAVAELENIARKFGREILVVDNILDRDYFKEFLPRIAEFSPPLLLHYEVKVNLTANELLLLSEAGVRKIQPGVESLSTHILKLMRKGTSMLRNVQTLKLAAEAGIFVEWGYLYGFPLEQVGDYDSATRLVLRLTHLAPPSAFTRVRADRFSPYFNTPEQFGITIHPLPAYRFIHPLASEAAVRRLAYHFDIVRAKEPDMSLELAYEALSAALQGWVEVAGRATLSVHSENEHSIVVDNRDPEASVEHRLTGCAHRILTRAAEIVGMQAIYEEIGCHYTIAEIDRACLDLLESGLLEREGDAVLALPLRQPGWRRSPLKDEIRGSLYRAHFYLTRSAKEAMS